MTDKKQAQQYKNLIKNLNAFSTAVMKVDVTKTQLTLDKALDNVRVRWDKVANHIQNKRLYNSVFKFMGIIVENKYSKVDDIRSKIMEQVQYQIEKVTKLINEKPNAASSKKTSTAYRLFGGDEVADLSEDASDLDFH